MKLNIALTKLTGVPDPSGWVQVHDFTPANDQMLVSRGRLFALISMLPQNGATLPPKQELIVGREIVLRLHEDYYKSSQDLPQGEVNPLELLKSSVQKIHDNFSSPNESLQIIVGIFLADKIIVAGIGQVQAWIQRGDKRALLYSENTAVTALAGTVQNNDQFYLGTSSFFKSNDLGTTDEKNNLDSTSGIIHLKIDVAVDSFAQVASVPNINNNTATMPNLPTSPKPVSPIRLSAAHLIDKILLHIPNKKTYIQEDFVNPTNNKRKKVASLAGVVLLALLIVSILFGLRQQKILNSKSQYEPILLGAQHNLDDAERLASVNAQEARNLILTAYAQINSLKSQNIKDSRIADLSTKIDNDLGRIAGIYQTPPSLYLDLGLISSNFKGDDLKASDDRMVILDKAGKRLVSINISSSQKTDIAGPDIMPNALLVAAYSDRNFVSSDSGIWEIGTKASVVIPTDKEVGTNNLIAAYTGNIYVLDKDNSVVWRYQGDGGQFGAKQNWFGAGIKPDLSNIISWTVDGNIWMLSKDGQILKFTSGSPIDFNLKGMDKDMQAIDITTSADSKYLYVLDTGNSRVVVINKDDGSYVAQYLSDNIKNATKLIVSEVDKKIILLEGQSLYSLDLKHL